MCLNPKWIYKKGNYKEDNYRGKAGDFYEIGTYSKCGACEQCNAERANSWVVRNYYEAQRWENIAFITLTYAENPIILVKKDLQDFIKRLRRSIEYEFEKKYKSIKKTALYKELKEEFHAKNMLRFFAAGEYGEYNHRPHFHLILYNFKDVIKFLDINKSGNILFQGQTIQKIWGLGRTSLQEFDVHEIPYISLYETPKEQFKNAYKMTREKVKQIERIARSNKNMNSAQRNNLFKELKEIDKQLKKSKEQYMAVKEFNTWSTALGWEKFYDEYAKQKIYTFKEYIEDKEFITPTSWVKKLANLGDLQAIQEMYRREEEIGKISANEETEKQKNLNKLSRRRKKEIMEWNNKKDKIENL